MANFRLVARSGPAAGKEFPLDKNEMFIGRDMTNEIIINDAEVSRRHARLSLQGTGYVLEDLASTNGTFVNGQRLMGPHLLRAGEVITLGERINLVVEGAPVVSEATVVAGGMPPATAQASQPPVTPSAPPPERIAPPISSPKPVMQPSSSFTPPPPAPKKSKTGLIVAIVVVVLLCLCLIVAGLGGYFFWPDIAQLLGM
ncbi:MAG TPA: FHA domain-containing protein [Anaerolineaceae bacterium]